MIFPFLAHLQRQQLQMCNAPKQSKINFISKYVSDHTAGPVEFVTGQHVTAQFQHSHIINGPTLYHTQQQSDAHTVVKYAVRKNNM